MFEPEFRRRRARAAYRSNTKTNDDSVYEDSQAETSFSDIQREATEAELRLT